MIGLATSLSKPTGQNVHGNYVLAGRERGPAPVRDPCAVCLVAPTGYTQIMGVGDFAHPVSAWHSTSAVSGIENSKRRLFSPRFVTALGSHFVAVDRVQPVVVSISADGQLRDIRSWSQEVTVPELSTWPNQQFSLHGKTLFFQRLPAGEIVAIQAGANGNLETWAVDRVPAGASVTVQPRMWTAPPIRYPTPGGDGTTWLIESMLDQFFWSARVTLNSKGGVSRWLDIPNPASIVSYSSIGTEVAALCVQRANKRPWPFCPEIELWLTFAGPGVLYSQVLPSIDITDLCWENDLTSEAVLRRKSELSSYLSYSAGQYQGVREYGAEDVELVLSGDVSTGDSTIDIRFMLDEVPGVTSLRRDKPFDELGNLAGGLRDMNVSLVEDLQAGLAQRLRSDGPETVAL